ncbi:MAG: M48 family metalloprotease [Xanthomonadales bacterium]|nr:M48 family metalloprotease [Xanthomonadales bacterium]
MLNLRSRRRTWRLLASALTVLLAMTGCATNPVTGKNELALVSEAQELKIGAQQYSPSRQMQGGDYIVDPNVARYVQDVGQKLAEKSDRPLPYEFSVLNSSVPNAWALPGGKIAINRGLLLEMNTEAELAAVLGHEIVHAAARHGAKGLERGLLLQGAVLASAVASRNSDYSQYAVGAASVAAQLINQKYGRGAELESDEYGMIYMSRAGYDVQGAVELQKTFVRLSEGRRQDWLSGLFASHPPSAERVAQNAETAQQLPAGGTIGRDAYQRAMARLRATKPAYDAHDKGRKALSEGKPDEALRLAREAIAVEPEEALFYGLMGDVEYARKRYQQAVSHYSEALRRHDAYFKYYLGRGESYRKLNRMNLAEADLKASVELLPTADAMAALGQISESQGNLDQAIAYYESAASSRSPAGRTSSERLVKLDLPRRPDRYISIRRQIDNQGRVYIELGNRTSVPVSDVVVVLAYRDSSGRTRQEQRVHRGTIAPGKTGLIALGGNPYASALDSLQFAVRGARVN